MVQLEFKKWERADDGTLSSLGKVIDAVGKDGKIAFIPRNIKDLEKRVVVVLTKKDGTSAMVTCSEQVSKDIRAGRVKEGHLLNLEILQNEDGINFISAQGGLVEFNISDIKVEEFVPKAKSVSIAQLLEASA